MDNRRKKTAFAIVKWALIIVGAVALFLLGRGEAFRERGYSAIGGEALLLLLPIIYWLAERTLKDWAADIKELFPEREKRSKQ